MHNTSSKIAFFVQLIALHPPSPPQSFLLMHGAHMRNKSNQQNNPQEKLKTLDNKGHNRKQQPYHKNVSKNLPTYPTQPNLSHSFGNRLRNCGALTSRK